MSLGVSIDHLSRCRAGGGLGTRLYGDTVPVVTRRGGQPGSELATPPPPLTSKVLNPTFSKLRFSGKSVASHRRKFFPGIRQGMKIFSTLCVYTPGFQLRGEGSIEPPG